MSSGSEKWLDYACYSLYFCGVMLILSALLGISMTLGIGPLGGVSDEQSMIFDAVLGIFMFAIGIVVGPLNFLVALGLKKRRLWAFVSGILFGIIYSGSACLPFGVVILYALFKNKDAFSAKQKTE